MISKPCFCLKVSAFAMLVAVFGSHQLALGQTTIDTEDFEVGYNAGDQVGSAADWNGFGTVQDSPGGADGHGLVLNIQNTSNPGNSGGNNWLFGEVVPSASNQFVSISYDQWMTADTARSILHHVQDNGVDTLYAAMSVGLGGASATDSVNYVVGGGWQAPVSYDLVPNTWMRINYTMDQTNNTFDLEIDGNLVINDGGIWNNTVDGVDLFNLEYRGGAPTAYVDNLVLSIPDVAPTTSTEWFVNASGDWSVPTNWNPSVPDSNIITAVFGSAIAGPGRTVYTDSDVTVNSVQFDNSSTYNIAGIGSVNFETDPSGPTAPSISVTGGGSAGAHQFQAKVSLTDSATVDVAASSSLDFNNEIDLNGNTLDTTPSAGTVNINHSVVGGGAITASAALGTAGSTSIAADLTLSGASTLDIDLGNFNTDHFDVTGNVVLDPSSVVDVTLEAGFVPTGSYTVLTASGTLTATGLTLDPSDTGLFSLSVLSNTVVLTALAGLPGDFDGNGVVDGADFLTWQRDLGDASNLGLWQANYGAGALAAAAGAAAVPEPTTLLLTIAGVIGLTLHGGRRSRSS
jgi:hypothetical protein